MTNGSGPVLTTNYHAKIDDLLDAYDNEHAALRRSMEQLQHGRNEALKACDLARERRDIVTKDRDHLLEVIKRQKQQLAIALVADPEIEFNSLIDLVRSMRETNTISYRARWRAAINDRDKAERDHEDTAEALGKVTKERDEALFQLQRARDQLATQGATSDKDIATLSKVVADVSEERDDALAQLQRAIEERDAAMSQLRRARDQLEIQGSTSDKDIEESDKRLNAARLAIAALKDTVRELEQATKPQPDPSVRTPSQIEEDRYR